MNRVLRHLREPPVMIGAGLGLLILGHVAYYFPRVVDDVFISLRYAENLATGHGAVYNAGERVEGYSSAAWMLVQALGIALGFEPVTFTKVLGITCLIATAFGTRTLVRRLYGINGWAAWIPAFAVAANSYLVNWTVLGLETPFHVAMLVLCPIALRRALDASNRTTLALGVLAVVGLGTSRPESVLYLVANFAAPFAFVRSREELRERVRRLWPVAAIAGAILAALLGLRFAYYGELVPNTYFVKGAHASFDIEKLAQLWSRGSTPVEALLLCGGVLLLAFYSVRHREIAPVLTCAICLYFTSTVAVDWMPSLRHLLPLTVLAPLGWAMFVDDLERRYGPSIGKTVAAVFCSCSVQLVSVDVRISAIEHRDVWVKRKTLAKWSDTVLAYRRIEPPHVTQMPNYDMGQISQAWPVLETSADPVERSWYGGRDIGAVGFYTGVLVFDTAGLVTKDVARSTAWAARNEVPDDLVKALMARQPVVAEIFDGWDAALGRHPALFAKYRVHSGSQSAPNRIVAVDRTAPSREELLRRYRAFVAKFPRAYHMHTLYGEAFGAAVEKRLRIVSGG